MMTIRKHTDAYAREIEPAIPVIRKLKLWVEGTEWSQVVQAAILDSGADQSLLPRRVVADVLESVQTTTFIVEGLLPPETEATGVKLRFGIGDFDEHEAWFILLGEEPIIGRDVLNRYRAILDGPPLDGDYARVTLERIDDA